MDMAERNGALFFRVLAFADCNRERAISFGFRFVKTPGSRTIARLFSVTFFDHFLTDKCGCHHSTKIYLKEYIF